MPRRVFFAKVETYKVLKKPMACTYMFPSARAGHICSASVPAVALALAGVLSFACPKESTKEKGSLFYPQKPWRRRAFALFLTGMGAFFGTFRLFSSCQKRPPLLRRDHPLRSGAPRRPHAKANGRFVGWLGIFSFFVLGINKFEQKSMPGSVQMALEKSPF